MPKSDEPEENEEPNVHILVAGEAPAGFHLADGQSLTIGRTQDATYSIFDESVSRRHAKIARRGDRIYLVPYLQPCPTSVGGRPVEGSRRLRSGNVLQIGAIEGVTVQFGGDLPVEEAPRDPGTRVRNPKETQFHENSIRTIREWFDLDVADDAIRVKLTDQHGAHDDIPWRIEGSSKKVLIGSSPECDIQIESGFVSSKHAEIRLEGGQVLLTDLDSANFTWLNKEALKKGDTRPLSAGAHVVIGDVDLQLNGEAFAAGAHHVTFRIEARDLNFLIPVPGGQKPVLQNVDILLRPGELVAVKGLSGSGKSVLFGLLSGRTTPTRGAVELPELRGKALEKTPRTIDGRVLYSGLDVADHIDELRPYVGYVAEENACIQSLTVLQWLRCAGRLRVPDINGREIDERIDKVLQDLLLSDKKNALLASLSLGQRKRILLATELVADTPVLFVDEVTSNVDVGSEESILGVLRKKVSRGHLVIMITHHDINLEDFDTVLFMCRGRLVYAGDPTALLKFFDAVDFRDLNKAVKSDAPVGEQDRMAALHERAFLSNTKVSGAITALKASPVVKTDGKVPGPGVTNFPRQLRAMFTRNAQAFLKDRGALFFALAFGPLVALFLGLTIDTSFDVDTIEVAKKLNVKPEELAMLDPQAVVNSLGSQLLGDEFWEERQAVITTVFFRKAFQAVLIIVVVISGLLIASMQIVKEQHLYTHERTVGVRRDAFLAAKMGWLTVVGAVMALGIAYTATWVSDSGGPPTKVALLLFTTAIASLALGLAVSAWAKSPEVALFAALGLVVLQIVFSGVIPALGGAAKVGGYLSPSFFGARGMLSTLDVVTMTVLAKIDTETSALSAPATVIWDVALTAVFLGLAWWGLAKRDQRGVQRE